MSTLCYEYELQMLNRKWMEMSSPVKVDELLCYHVKKYDCHHLLFSNGIGSLVIDCSLQNLCNPKVTWSKKGNTMIIERSSLQGLSLSRGNIGDMSAQS